MRALCLIALLLAPMACAEEVSEPDPEATRPPPLRLGELPYETLSEYGFFLSPMVEQRPALGVVPYTVAAPLWADLAGKGRFVVLPEGQQIGFEENEDWDFPLGTVIIKTFFFATDRRDPEGSARIIETRLLILEDEGWSGHTYVWDEAQAEARLEIAGQRIGLDFIDEDGSPGEQLYLVPNNNECGNCHERDDENRVLGLTTPQLNATLDIGGQALNQLQQLIDADLFSNPPTDLSLFESMVEPFGGADLDRRARDYLHANCAHRHREGGGGGRSGLSLLRTETDPFTFGICKGPVAAGKGSGGLRADIVPGDPDQSILVFRMGSTDPEIKMPELPNRLPDEPGVDLISAWISAMEPPGCP